MEKNLLVTNKDIHKCKILKEVIDGKITGKEASNFLGLSYVHISRLKTKLVKHGFEGLLRKYPSSPPNRKITKNMINEISNLR